MCDKGNKAVFGRLQRVFIPWMNCCLVSVFGRKNETVSVTVAYVATTDSFRRDCFDTVKCVLNADLLLIVICCHSVVLISLGAHKRVSSTTVLLVC